MKMIVIHDKSGRIRSAGAPAPEFAGQLQLVASRGQRAVEVDTEGAGLEDLGRAADPTRAALAWKELTQKFRIDSKGKLLRQKRR